MIKRCACSEHICSTLGTFSILTAEGPVPLCRHCFLMGHAWLEEYRQLEELADDWPEHDAITDHQLEADRYHGRA